MGMVQPLPPARTARLAGALLGRYSAAEIADAIEVMVDILDALGGDPDSEDNADLEPAGDGEDWAWSEWHTRNSVGLQAGVEAPAFETCGTSEDDEDDDPAGQCDEDGVNTELDRLAGHGPGCMIADEDFDYGGAVPSYGEDQTRTPVLA